MGWLSGILSRTRRRSRRARRHNNRHEANGQRHCAFEIMEPRRMLSASPLQLGTIYIEEDLGSDLHGDRFEVTFTGGATDTQLTRLLINGDQNQPGFNVGDVFFDTASSGYGGDHAIAFHIEQLDAQDPNASVTAHVPDGQTLLTLDFNNFRAGDRLVFTIDVDEVVHFDPAQTDLNQVNDGFDPITSGVEFQGAQLTAYFAAPDYRDASSSVLFWNRYDDALQQSGLPLPADDDGGLCDRSAGAFMHAQQQADPATISGYVYADNDNDGKRDLGEPGIGGVTLQIIPLATAEPQSVVSVATDANGFYQASNLMPGTYRIVEVAQPGGYLDGLDAAGTVDGVPRGFAVNPGDNIEQILLSGGTRGSEYNFGEIVPASLEGSVQLSDADGNCCCSVDGQFEPLADVSITLWNEQGNLVAQTQTDANGHYSFGNLPPGTYRLTELTPAGLIDAGAAAGRVGAQVRGDVIDDNNIGSIRLQPTEHGTEYDFCEHLPARVSGHVYHDRNNDSVRQNEETPIAGVSIGLYDDAGQLVATTQTSATGYYEFTDLRAGNYSLRETQPVGWLDGREAVGQVDGKSSGRIDGDDQISGLVLRWGSSGVQYDFGELQPGSITGRVHADLNHDCIFDPGEELLEHVQIQLMDASGTVIATTLTDAAGAYAFRGLAPGTYAVHELQPEGYFQGSQHAGSHGGNDLSPDLITQIPIGSSESLTDYDFCELPPGSLAGGVFLTNGTNCNAAAGVPLSGVQLDLVSSDGLAVGTTHTDSAGRYQFDNLVPGTYTVRETQPSEYFQGSQNAGSGGGDDQLDDIISAITLAPGAALVDYNFCELPASSISGYVFQDGPPLMTPDGQPPEDLAAVRNGQRTADDQPISGVVLELRHGINGRPIDGSEALEGYYPAGPIHTVTDADGYYQFDGLPRGNYAVFEIQPSDYVDGIDTPGTTSGLAFNPNAPFDISTFFTLDVDPHNDGIIRIPVAPGQTSAHNNFSEVRIEQPVVPPLPPPPLPPVLAPPPSIIAPPTIAWRDNPIGQPTSPLGFPEHGTANGLRQSWHLSVIDGGSPRGNDPIQYISAEALRPVSYLSSVQWVSTSLDHGHWSFAINQGLTIGKPTDFGPFGMPGAIPLSGDFNGDGIAETAVYFEGQWFIDLNGNGRWDKEDLWARLGGKEDLPVVGDWDGDGKDDIGIFGPQWHGDPRAIRAEPGLPDSANTIAEKPKNLPPEAPEATDGHRVLKHTANGDPRLDVIDHVFRFGVSDDVPITGDWNGDGITNIGVFRSGTWYLDLDGDGRFTERDMVVHYGEQGDTPVVGDFNGDGTDEIGIYRGGAWQIDSNGNRKPDPGDAKFNLGQQGARPIVGDWNGDGVDDPGVYRDAG